MTAHAMNGDDERCLAAGMDGYIPKPIEARKLLDCLHDILRPALASRSGRDRSSVKSRDQLPGSLRRAR